MLDFYEPKTNIYNIIWIGNFIGIDSGFINVVWYITRSEIERKTCLEKYLNVLFQLAMDQRMKGDE